MGNGAPRDYLMLIGAGWTAAESGATLDSVDPSTGEVWARVPDAGAADVDRAVAAYYSPTILTGVDPGSTIAQTEVFGPVLVVIPFSDEAEAVRINTYRAVSPLSPFGGSGLSGHGRENGAEAIAAFTKSKSVWVELSEEVQDPFVLRV